MKNLDGVRSAGYELTLILDPKATSAKKKSVLETLEKQIKILGGKAEKAEDWGVKDMFYTIGKNNQGAYLHLPFELPAKSVKQFDQKLKMEENIVRFLIVKA